MATVVTAGELIVDVLADVSELKTGFAEVRNILKKADKRVGTFDKIWTGALRRVGEKATDFAFKAVKAPFKLALKSVVGLGKGMAKLAKTSVLDAAKFQTRLSEVASLGVQQMAKLRDGILEVSSAVGQDLIVSTQAAYEAISAGIPEGNVIDFLKVGSKAAIAGVTDMKTAVDALSSAVNAYGASADEAIDFSDQFFQIIKLGKTTFPELAQGIGMVLPTAAALGVEFNEVGGALALMTQKGINTKQAVTALNQLLLQLLKPAEQVAGEVDKIVKAAGGFEDLDLSKVISQFSSLSTQVQVGLVGSVEAVKAVLALGDGGGAERETIIDKIAQDAVEASIELRDLKKKEEALAETRGLDRFNTGLSKLSASAMTLGIPMENVAAALGTMVERGTATTTAVGALQKIFSALENPSANVEKAINAIVEDAGGLEKIDLKKVVEEFGGLDKKVRQDILGGIREMDAALKLTDKKGANAFEDKLRDIEREAKKAARSAKKEFSALDKVIAEIGGAEGATETAFQMFVGDFELEVGKFKQTFKNFAVELATPVAEAIGEVFEQINEKITPSLTPIAKIIKEWFTGLWEGGVDVQAARQMADGMGIGIKEAFNILGGDEETAEFAQILSDGFGISLEEAFGIVAESASLKSTISDLVTRIGGTMTGDVQGLLAGDTTLVDVLSGWMTSARERVGEEIDILFDTQFTTRLKSAWEENEEQITQAAKDFGVVIGTAVGKGLLATVPAVADSLAIAYGEVVFNITDSIWSFLNNPNSNIPNVGRGGIRSGAGAPGSFPALPAAPTDIQSPGSLVQQITQAPALARAAPAANAGTQDQRPINITINQLPGEDSISLANQIREVLLDINRFGNSRGIVAAEAFV